MPFRIRTKLLIAFFSMLVPIVVLDVISHFNQKVIYQGVERVEEVSLEMRYLEGLQIAIDRAVMPPNDYLITGDIREKKEFEGLISDIEKQIEGITRLSHPYRIRDVIFHCLLRLFHPPHRSHPQRGRRHSKGRIQDGVGEEVEGMKDED